jgi:regulator of sigma E protease
MLDETHQEVPDHLRAQAFNRQSVGRRALIVLAGPVANLALALVLLTALMAIGQAEWRARLGSPAAGSLMQKAGVMPGDEVVSLIKGETTVEIGSYQDLRWQMARAGADRAEVTLILHTPGGQRRDVALDLASLVADVSEADWWRELGLTGPWSAPTLSRVLNGGQAEKMNLRSGDRVIEIDGKPIADASVLRQAIRGALGPDGQALKQVWRVQRLGHLSPIEIEVTPRVMVADGRSVGRLDAMVGAEPEQVWIRHEGLEALSRAWGRLIEMTTTTLAVMGKMISGQAPWTHISGPVTMAEQAGQSAQMGWAAFVNYLVWVSFSLGLLNLLPIPALDGGHLMCYLYESVARQPIPAPWMSALQRMGMLLILALMVLALRNDLLRWWGAG